ncbi:hypothetical protein Leryth_010510 [Lithospermum erythrorhizon]|nr:hypothetical protein Leryth_010510 [Lithospermum erythrorhizon]
MQANIWIAAQKLIHHWKIVREGTGIIKRVVRSQNRVIVEGKNLVKKHIKQGQGHEGGIFTVEAPLHVSNVQGKNAFKYPHVWLFTFLKLRTHIYFFSGSIIPRPEILKIRTTARPTVGNVPTISILLHFCLPTIFLNLQSTQNKAGPKDTPMDVVMEKTYDSKTGLGMPDL